MISLSGAARLSRHNGAELRILLSYPHHAQRTIGSSAIARDPRISSTSSARLEAHEIFHRVFLLVLDSRPDTQFP
jgi:hypothetical protein